MCPDVLHCVPLRQFTLLLGHWLVRGAWLPWIRLVSSGSLTDTAQPPGSPSCSFLSRFPQSGYSALLSTTYRSLPTGSHSCLLACKHRITIVFSSHKDDSMYLHSQTDFLFYCCINSSTFSLILFGVGFS